MQGINTTNVLAVFLLLIGMFAVVQAAMPTRKHAPENEDRMRRAD